MPEACPAGDDRCLVRLERYLPNEWSGNPQGKIIFRIERAERSRHSATSGLEQRNLRSRNSARQRGHEARFHQRFGVTMRVNRDGRFPLLEAQGLRLARENVFHKTLEQYRAASPDR